jgi:hypothetical protein
MKYRLTASELLALFSVVVIYPVLSFIGLRMTVLLGDIGGYLPPTIRYSLSAVGWNSLGLPSLAGVVTIIGIRVIQKDTLKRAILCHAVSVAALVYLAAVVAGLMAIAELRS